MSDKDRALTGEERARRGEERIVSDLREEAFAAAIEWFKSDADNANTLADLLLAWHARGVAQGREEAREVLTAVAMEAWGYGCGTAEDASAFANMSRAEVDKTQRDDCAGIVSRALPAPEGSEG